MARPTSREERKVLRELIAEKGRAAEESRVRDRETAWRRLNDLDEQRPLVWINEEPWRELAAACPDELVPRCRDPFLRSIEVRLRRELFRWNHYRGDAVVKPEVACPMAVDRGALGVPTAEDTIAQLQGDISSHGYRRTIDSLKDLEVFQYPEVTHDVEESSRRLATLEEIADGLLPVVLRGVSHQWFALWDRIIQNLGVEEAMLDLVQNPELIHELMKRMRDAWMSRLDQLEAQGLLATNHENERVGSGGYAYSSQVPSQGFDPGHIRPIDQWGCGNAQIFAGVSPAMHEEFSLQYERPWLARFGLVYYGCCEQLHDRLHLLESVRNLRKVSASPWADKQSMRELCLGRYVISVKPSPAVFAEDTYSEDVAERDLRRDLDATRGANVEVVLKDISTVRGDPSRLFRWADMASRVVKEYEA